MAVFSSPKTMELILRCNRVSRRIDITRVGGASGAMAVRTSAGDFTWPALGATDGRPAQAMVTLPPNDRAFDAIAYSRGRISVEASGVTRLILPVWAEISRVIEDCRG
jgi:hypothetical protein